MLVKMTGTTTLHNQRKKQTKRIKQTKNSLTVFTFTCLIKLEF